MVSTSTMVEFSGVGVEQLPGVARSIVNEIAGHNICLIEGEMGAGKTTLIRELCKSLGVSDNVSSPTFSLVNEYKSSKGPVYHFDFYRINSLSEALDAGVEEYFYSGHPCFIEWPDIVRAILPEKFARVEIELGDNLQRIYKLSLHGSH